MVLEDLPYNLSLEVVMCLDCKSIYRLEAVSKRWLTTIKDNATFWKRKFEGDFGELPNQVVDFEKEYKLEFSVRCLEPKVTDLEGHSWDVIFMQAFGSTLVSVDDRTVRVWDLDTMECVQHIREKDLVHSAACDGNQIFTSVGHGEIRVWSVDSGRLVSRWRDSFEEVPVLGASSNLLISCDIDGQLKLWDTEDYEEQECFEGGSMWSVHVEDEEIICGLEEAEVRVFHPIDGLLYSHTANEAVYRICANSRYIFAGLDSLEVQVWDRATEENVATLKAGGQLLSGVGCDRTKVMNAQYGGPVEVWDTRTWKRVRVIESNAEKVVNMHYGQGKIFLGMRSGTIKVLDFNI